MLDELKKASRLRSLRSLRSLRRQQRQVLIGAHRLLSERGEANSQTLARELLFERLSADFNPDPQAVLAAAQAYADTPNARHLVRLRRSLLTGLAKHPEWRSVESDLLHLFGAWFNPGFLQMRQVDWNSPAQLLEQIIRHEAVHEIDGWDDLRRRLQPDRRLFAFFHPQLPEEPLIAKSAPTMTPDQFKVAVFYSISNCEPGLKGVSLGNFLIKRVAEHLQREHPRLKTFCTSSPIPGFAAWLQASSDFADLSRFKKAQLERLNPFGNRSAKGFKQACGLMVN